MSIETIVIVGAGQAGASAILELRANGYTGKIILVGDEVHLPYERPPLSKDVILKPEETKVEILSAQKLAELGVEVIRGNAVVKIDADTHQLILKMVKYLVMTSCYWLPVARRAACRTWML